MKSSHPNADRLLSHADACVVVCITLVLGFSQSAFAYPGEQILNWTANNILAPISLLALVLGIAASIFRPELIKHAAYVLFISAILFFIIKSAPALMTAMKS